MPRKWFQTWFNSPYYHILYHQRNDEEAEFFVDNLCAYLQPAAQFRILDIACGRGRHSIYLNKKGYEVTGIDLSESNVRHAKAFENEHLHFFVHDMRHLFYTNYFDLAFNLFTSFGYFESRKDHVKALKMFYKSLKPGAKLVMDYFNTSKILQHIPPHEVKTAEGIDFHISKQVKDGKIVKSIAFEHHGKSYGFKEEVQAFVKADFEEMFAQSGFLIEEIFGNYHLQPYEESGSDRMIFICTKPHA